MRTSLDFFENSDYPSIRRQIDRLRRRRAPKRLQPSSAHHEDDIVTASANDECTSAAEFAADAELEPPTSEPKVRAAWYLARAVSPSPAAVTHDVVQVCRDSGLNAAAIVELVTWVSVLQMLHRVSAFFINQRHA